jgi:hypothetical protein
MNDGFRVGDTVKCIDAGTNIWIETGGEYVIISMEQGITNLWLHFRHTVVAYEASRFVPIHPRQDFMVGSLR